ncbi:GPI mannosyltransferase 2 [Penicillium capsulatum]|uniref:GPI mannosyltransferase 2 n=1 Tax=Penicillium capsulatum TaxID=69766 RepID=A0A9W9IRA3_9EURO|nr:GPI mannosyltransferase 2 [Penicillium capsulatum]
MGSMASAMLLRLDTPIRSLTLAFCLWKALLFVVIVACPGLGYDTSTTTRTRILFPPTSVGSLSRSLKFTRWDSIYFLHIAEHGHVFEQEWAFNYPRILGLFMSGIQWSGGEGGPVNTAFVGVALSHVAHYLSVLALYQLSGNIFGHATIPQRLICFLSAALHIISPGGAFLSAPYGESIFSFLNFSGFYLYSSSLIAERNGITGLRDFQVLLASGLFAIATVVRSNGILSGFLFAYDALLLTWETLTRGPSRHSLRRLAVIIVGGGIVAVGMVVPQIMAYRAYCLAGGNLRPWCGWSIPSIYSWVQGTYWNVGFLRYWTVSNIPLFLLAAPLLAILCRSSLWALQAPSTLRSKSGETASSLSPGSMLFRLAVPQGLLAVMALTSYHVQIINRISSGYPLWYWYLVSTAMDNFQDRHKHRGLPVAAQAMVAYALIQGVLFGSFLPPA